MTKFLQTLMDGIAVGSLYALIALGYTMVYGILQFINFAHSDVFMLGAWLSYAVACFAGFAPGVEPGHLPGWTLQLTFYLAIAATVLWIYERFIAVWLRQRTHLPFPQTQAGTSFAVAAIWALLILVMVKGTYIAHHSLGWPTVSAAGVLLTSMALCGLIGFSIERSAYKPLRNAPRLNVLITAIGVSLFLENMGQLRSLFGTQPKPMPPVFPDKVLATFHTGEIPVQLHRVDLLVFVLAVVLMFGLERLVFGTKIGRAMRAVSFDTRTASLMGIPVDFVISITFVVGAMLAAAAGFLYAAKYPGLNQSAAAQWILLGLKAFVAAVVGGIGNIRGAMLGGLLIGLIEFFGASYVSSNLKDVYVFTILIAVLLFKPTGILGKPYAEKV